MPADGKIYQTLPGAGDRSSRVENIRYPFSIIFLLWDI
jgi:hypothetical protein